MNEYTTENNFTPRQGILPIIFDKEALSIDDPVLDFEEVMDKMDLKKYLKEEKESDNGGRPSFDPIRMLKTILYGFNDMGYISLRKLEDNCKVNIRYMYLMDYQTPSYKTFGNFINDYMKDSIAEVFMDINKVLFEEEAVDLNHIYIDGTKLEANANKYTWVWKKATEKSRYRLFEKITKLFTEINDSDLKWENKKIDTKPEYNPEELEIIAKKLLVTWNFDPATFVSGKGHRKSQEQRWYQQLTEYTSKLSEYVEKIDICGPNRNSYSKTDHDATFMRIKKDYMGNDQLLPAYNVQMGIADEYIAVVDVNQYRSDMDCFVPLMEKFHDIYGFYPEYAVADAGYGSYNNYIFCEQHGIKKYMKFPMYEKEVKDKKYQEDPYRAVNFRIGEDGKLRCPKDREFVFSHREPVKGNLYGRQNEIYKCVDCSNCPYSEKCKKGKGNRTIRLNEELTGMHKEVIDNLESIQGALLRMNRSIQAEGTFGIIKNDRCYDRICRKGLDSVILEIFLVSIGHNLYKYHKKKRRRMQELKKLNRAS